MKKYGPYLWVVALVALVFVREALGWMAGPHRSAEARRARTFADVRGGLKFVLQMFKDDCGRYPTTTEGLKILITPPANGSLTNWRGPYIDLPEAPKDSWGHEYIYRFPGVHNTNGYDLYSKGPDGVSKSDGHDADDIGNW